MALEPPKSANADGGLLDLERELSCSICTDILFQPLTLLDCLHTFCGGCLQEWFKWQATSAKASRRPTNNPYTCPSCREHVRDTKADWRLSTLLEGYLKANPAKGKTDKEKDESRQHYAPGDNVLPPVTIEQESDDSEDERLMAEVRELSMADVDPETARRRAERAARHRQRRRQERETPRESTRNLARQTSGQQHAEAERQHEVEHQPSLRTLLSGSEISSRHVQEEILQSIYSEGLLNGVDIDNLTPEQEEELTERIAEAYRRRQRNRERSRNRDRSSNGENRERSGRSPRDSAPRTQQSPPRSQPRTEVPAPAPMQQSRTRPPISRPHLFEQQASAGAERIERPSVTSTTSHRRQASDSRNASTDNIAPAARSATDLSLRPATDDSQRTRPRARSSNPRSTTDPTNLRQEVQRVRNTSGSLRPDATNNSSRSRSRESDPARSQIDVSNNAVPAPLSVPVHHISPPQQQSVRPVVSTAAFAPEPVVSSDQTSVAPSISCSRCSKPDIQTHIHYNCSKCNEGNFNLCKQCYRAGQGCNHWFGFGNMAMYRYEQYAPPEGHAKAYDYPHLLTARRYETSATAPSTQITLREGAFCEICSAFTNDCYWSCSLCFDGAWGYCNACVLQGRHCPHPLLPVAHLSTLHNTDPSRLTFPPVPNLKPNSYVLLPVLTDCDICRVPIPPSSPRYHCYTCSKGDYDICNTCYNDLVASHKLSTHNGPNGWRRCPQGHRMAIVGYQDSRRITFRDPVGGWRLKDDDASAPAPANQTTGYRCVATWSWFPGAEAKDELTFPRLAEISECEDVNEDWSVGVYAKRAGVFPRNYVKRV